MDGGSDPGVSLGRLLHFPILTRTVFTHKRPSGLSCDEKPQLVVISILFICFIQCLAVWSEFVLLQLFMPFASTGNAAAPFALYPNSC